ncbi:MAG: D-alanine-D-alanine ligase [Actinomycetota bacterium]|jgi:D-alanine-D-alanine ligase
MTDSPRVLVLAGGISHEREISLNSGRLLSELLTKLGINVELRDSDAGLIAALRSNRPDAVWPVLHGASGEDGSLLGLLEAMSIPYVGSGPDATRLAWDKPSAKTVVSRAGIPTPESLTLTRDAFRELGADDVLGVIESDFGFPVVVKPAYGGSAQGVSQASDLNELRTALVHAYTYSAVAIIERRIVGTEVCVTILDNGDGSHRALPVVEIEPISGVYGFEERYNAGETRFFAPARVTEAVGENVQHLALRAHESLGLRHLSRIDFIIDAEGTPWFLEASVSPGLTDTSTALLALSASDLDAGEAFSRIIDSARR